jgi:hypothetical protein
MMKKILIASILGMFILSGCCLTSELKQAKTMIHNGEAECVVLQNDKIVAIEKGRGISPLLKIYDEKGDLIQNAIIVDKVIGRAAAFITIKGGAAAVHGKIMSEEAQTLLREHGIKTSYDLLVPRILNNKRDGLCPLEDSVKNITSPYEALPAMRQRIKELRKK